VPTGGSTDVSFGEALTVFVDPLARIHDDSKHSDEERREITSLGTRLLAGCYWYQPVPNA
jgi:uncharacterized DUF497 family protein